MFCKRQGLHIVKVRRGVDYTFDLRSSYTYLHTEADVKVKQMLPALIDSSLFEITREQYRGY